MLPGTVRTGRPAARVVVGLLAALTLLLAGCAGGGTSSSGPADPGVTWRTGNDAATALDAYRDTPWNTDDAEDPRVVSSPDGTGDAAIEFTVPGGGSRSELEPATSSFGDGDEYWFGFGVHLDDGFPADTSDWQVIAQWKNYGDGSPPLSIKVQDGRFVLDGGAGIGEQWQRDIGPAPVGETTELVLRVHFSDDPDEAAVDVIQDGTEVLTDFHPPAGTLYSGESSYLKLGLYRSSDIDTEGTVTFTDAVVAGSREAAATRARAS